MTSALLMHLVAALAAGTGAALLYRSRPHTVPKAQATLYLQRLSGTMLIGFGIILFTFATAYAVAIR